MQVSSYKTEIDGIRALSILLVILFHYFPELVPGGFIGVDMFFVISGYLITEIIHKDLITGQFQLKYFFARRVRRIAPSLGVVLIFVGCLSFFILVGNEKNEFLNEMLSSILFVQNFYLYFQSGYFETNSYEKLLVHLWSLSVEEQFYLVWPFMMLYLHRKSKLSFSSLICLTFLFFIISLLIVKFNNQANFYWSISRFWELLSGCTLAYFQKTEFSRKFKRGNLYSIFGCSLVIMAAFFFDKNMLYPGYFAIAPVIGTLFLIAPEEKSYLNKYFFSHKFLVYIGKISYPLYLWHWPLISFSFLLFAGEIPIYIKLFLLLISVMLSHITYLYIERPIRNLPPFKVLKPLGFIFLLLFLISWGGKSFARETNIREETLKSWRIGQCFIETPIPHLAKYDQICLNEGKNNKKVVVWGDSHAASLFPGINNIQNDNSYDLGQFTASGCPPIRYMLFRERIECENLNSQVIEKIKVLKNVSVIMAANWIRYSEDFRKENKVADQDFEPHLIDTIMFLKKINIKQIYLFGQLPSFKASQESIALRYGDKDDFFRTNQSYSKDLFLINEKIRQIAFKTNINFISPLDLICNPKGCELSILKKEFDPMSYDEAHLTIKGSNKLIQRATESKVLKLP
jgi:peptidoglycan/LPS O-acetylase OafA/YrhL